MSYIASQQKNPKGNSLYQAWREMVSDYKRMPQHAPEIILGALLSSRTLDIKIAHLVLIFKLSYPDLMINKHSSFPLMCAIR